MGKGKPAGEKDKTGDVVDEFLDVEGASADELPLTHEEQLERLVEQVTKERDLLFQWHLSRGGDRVFRYTEVLAGESQPPQSKADKDKEHEAGSPQLSEPPPVEEGMVLCTGSTCYGDLTLAVADKNLLPKLRASLFKNRLLGRRTKHVSMVRRLRQCIHEAITTPK